jgi:DNA-binding response OmpR family regulator
MRRILIVDSDAQVRKLYAQQLLARQDEIVEISDGIEAIALCQEHRFDIILLAAELPELDGLSTLKVLKRLCSTPVIMISEHDDKDERIRGLETGADDYLVKPVSPKELVLRIDSILKRGAVPERAAAFRMDGLEIDLLNRVVTVDSSRVELTAREYGLLSFLIQNQGAPLNREDLMCGAWGFDCFVESRNVDTYVKQLRKKLGRYGKFIVTRRGIGYQFDSSSVKTVSLAKLYTPPYPV